MAFSPIGRILRRVEIRGNSLGTIGRAIVKGLLGNLQITQRCQFLPMALMWPSFAVIPELLAVEVGEDIFGSTIWPGIMKHG
jgi:hypothetical protein